MPPPPIILAMHPAFRVSRSPAPREEHANREGGHAADPTPDLLQEIRRDHDFIDLRWWPDSNLDAPLDTFTNPGRAADLCLPLHPRTP